MAKTEPDRHWPFDETGLAYEAKHLSGISVRLRGASLHFNPGVLTHLRSARTLVVGGVSHPTNWLASLAPQRDRIVVLGAESNLASTSFVGGPVGRLKKQLISRADAYFVPGERSLDYLRAFGADLSNKPVLQMPNIIDERRYRPPSRDGRQLKKVELGLDPERRVVLVPARLEPFKGIDDLLVAHDILSPERTPQVVLVGTGSLADEVRRACDRHPWLRHEGHVAAELMPQYYTAADAVLLPSRADPSPLSVVEAIASGCTIALSTAVGNADEALEVGLNGWSFGAGAPNELAATLQLIADTPGPVIEAMGHHSTKTHLAAFSTDTVIERAADWFTALIEARP